MRQASSFIVNNKHILKYLAQLQLQLQLQFLIYDVVSKIMYNFGQHESGIGIPITYFC